MTSSMLTKETLDLVAALRPFTGDRGRRLIDTFMEIAQGVTNGMDAMDVTEVTDTARSLLADRLDSAISLSLILAASYLSEFVESSGLLDRLPIRNQP